MLNSRVPRRDAARNYRERSGKRLKARRRGSSGETRSRRVGLRGYKLNKRLATYLRGGQVQLPFIQRPSPHYTSVTHRRLLRDRIDEKEVTELVRLFKAGATKAQLAKQCGIGVGSVKKLLRQRGVKKKSRYDMLG
jgi:hypothetical protein